MATNAQNAPPEGNLPPATKTVRPPSELYLDELTQGVTRTINVMICHSWDVHTVTGRYVSTDFVMSDAKGNAIHGSAKANVAHNFLKLKEGFVYSIKNFVVQANREEYRIFRDDPYMIELDGAASVRRLFIKGDVAGYVTNVGRITYQKSGSRTLDFSLANGSGQAIRVTLWGGLGDALIEKKTSNVGLYPVVMTAMNVKLYNNKLYLSSGSSSQILDDPQIPALRALRTQTSEDEVTLSQAAVHADYSQAKEGTLENLLIWARNRKNDVSLPPSNAKSRLMALGHVRDGTSYRVGKEMHKGVVRREGSLESDKECLDDVTQVDKQNDISSENIDKIRQNVNDENRTKNSKPIKSYAHVAMNKETTMNNQLTSIPTVLNDSGEEVVIFYEEMVKIGSKKWEMTLGGQCVSHYMPLPMLNYHLRRMWARFGYKEIIDNRNGSCLFKFTREDELNEVAAKSPWVVHGKPLVVYKLDPSIGLDKVEPKVLPVWVKLHNMPMEAWTNIGISVIASCLGKPKIMDSMTTYVCKSRMGRTEFARMLVEIEAVKGLKEEIELQYRDKDQAVKGTKKVKVEYDWKQPICNHCNVFGHSFDKKLINRNKIWKQKQQEARNECDKGKDNSNIDKSFEAEFPPLRVEKQAINKGKDVKNTNRFSVLGPNNDEIKDWSQEMIKYLKRAWDADREKEEKERMDGMDGIVKDVLEDNSVVAGKNHS
ncbi:RNA-directed DNA polymerase, eukaryota, reverse transcriptase zinc-binding domain protein [Tanacetum coccineum]